MPPFKVYTLLPNCCNPRQKFETFTSDRLKIVENVDPESYDLSSITFSIHLKKDNKKVGFGGFTEILDGWPELWYEMTVKQKGYATEFAKSATRRWFAESMHKHEVEVAGYTLTKQERDDGRGGKKNEVKPRIYACVQLKGQNKKEDEEKAAGVKVLKKAGFKLVETAGTLQHFVLSAQ